MPPELAFPLYPQYTPRRLRVVTPAGPVTPPSRRSLPDREFQVAAPVHASWSELIRPAPPAPGSTLGPYTFEKKIGEGGVGEVHLAHDVKGNIVVIKVAKAVQGREPGEGPEEVSYMTGKVSADLCAEWQILRGLASADSSLFAKVYKVGSTPFSYAVMEYITGEDLSSVIYGSKRLTFEEALEIGAQLCQLQVLHDLGYIHKDLKPANIKIDRRGEGLRVVVLDFGIAEQIGVERPAGASISGTPAYMSPERFRDKVTLGTGVDIYALGIILYEMIAGVNPMVGEKWHDTAVNQIKKPFPALTIDEVKAALIPEEANRLGSNIELFCQKINALIQRMTAKDPNNRPQSMVEVARDLAVLESVLLGRA